MTRARSTDLVIRRMVDQQTAEIRRLRQGSSAPVPAPDDPRIADLEAIPQTPYQLARRPNPIPPTHPMRSSSPQPDALGDCFVVVNCHGKCWDGEMWVDDWRVAVQYRRPDHAYELCELEAKSAEMITGVAASVCYIPAGTLAASLAPFPDLSQVDLRDLARKPEVC